MKVLITGAQGMLGQQLVEVFKTAGHEVIATGRQDLDITNKGEVLSFIRERRPEIIINAAAYNFVDKIEDPEIYPLAYAVNAVGPGNLATAAKEVGALMVHYSTEYVFEGTKQEGYNEEDEPNPISKYGETKLAGERGVQDATDRYYICRVSKLFGVPGAGENVKESFPALMIRLAGELPELKINQEGAGSPTYVVDVARATLDMVSDKVSTGIYHVINEGPGVTPFEYAQEFFDLAGITTPYRAVPADYFGEQPAKRPAFAKLNNTKLKKLRPRVEALREFLKNQA